MDDKVFNRWVKDAEDFFGMVLQFKELRADYKQQSDELATIEKRKADALHAAESYESRVASAKSELTGLENSIRVVGDNLRDQKDKARQEFDGFVTSIQSEQKAIDAAIRKRQKQHEDFLKECTRREAEAAAKFAELLASHDEWKRAHGLLA